MNQRIGNISQFLERSAFVLNPICEALASSKEINQILLTAKSIAQLALTLGPDPRDPTPASEVGVSDTDVAVDVTGYAGLKDDAVASVTGTVNVGSSLSLTFDTAINPLETLTIDVKGEVQTISFGFLGDQIDTPARLKASLNAIDGVDAKFTENGELAISGRDAVASFTIGGTADIQKTFGIAEQACEPTNLLSQGFSQGDRLTFRVGKGVLQTITFGTGAGEVSTLAQLKRELAGLSGIAAVFDPPNRLVFRATNTMNTVTVGGTDNIEACLGVTRGRYDPAAGMQGLVAKTTRASLQGEYNALISKIDSLVSSADYRGVNFLSGDEYTLSRPENRNDSYSFGGHNLNVAALGLDSVAGEGLQSDSVINQALDALGAALGEVKGVIGTLDWGHAVVKAQSNSYQILSDLIGATFSALVVLELDQGQAQRVARETKSQLVQLISNARIDKGDVVETANPDDEYRKPPLLPTLIGGPDLSRILLSSIGETDGGPDVSRTIASA